MAGAVKLIRAVARAFGLEEIPDELVLACAHRVRIRCSKVDLTIYRRRQGQAALELAALEAIVGAFRDYFPDRAEKFHINGYWPQATATIRGNKAWLDIHIGVDYADPDEGLEVIEIQVNRVPTQIGILEKIEDVLFHRAPRRREAEKPPLDLTQRVPPAKEMAPTGRPEGKTKPAADARKKPVRRPR